MIFTAAWRELAEVCQGDASELPVKPVRISRGVPRFWRAAADFAAIPELFPPGWVFGVWAKDAEKGARCYRRGLHVLGVERVRELLKQAQDGSERPLALACFEANPADCHRGQFAAVWERKTGQRVPELSLLRRAAGGPATLVWELDEPADPAQTTLAGESGRTSGRTRTASRQLALL